MSANIESSPSTLDQRSISNQSPLRIDTGLRDVGSK